MNRKVVFHVRVHVRATLLQPHFPCLILEHCAKMLIDLRYSSAGFRRIHECRGR